MPRTKPDAFSQATKLLAASDKSTLALKQALERRDYSAEEVDAAVRRAQALGYLDEERVALKKARADIEAGWAGEMLTARLLQSGLDESSARKAVEQVKADTAWDAFDAGFRLLKKRHLSGLKAARFLASRGFDEGVVQRLVPQAMYEG